MSKIYPPIEEKDTEELIAIANSTSEFWQPEAIESAKQELFKRKVSNEEQQQIIDKWHLNIERQEQNNSIESYTKWEMIKIVLLTPMYLTCRLNPNDSLSALKAENFKRKYRQRIKLLIAGIILYIIFMIGLFKYVDFSNKRAAEKADIREWENNRIKT